MMDAERTTQACVDIPFRQSLITGLVSSLLFGLGALVVQRQTDLAPDWPTLAITTALAFAGGFALVWLLLLWSLWPRRPAPMPLLPLAEHPQPPPRERIIPVFTQRFNSEALKENERQLRFTAFLRECSVSTASRHLVRTFTPAEVEDYRGVLFTLGVADWNGAEPRQGWRLLLPVAEIAARLRIRL